MPSAFPRTFLRIALLALLVSAVACAGRTSARSITPARALARASTPTAATRDCPASAIRTVVERANAARRRAHLRALVTDARLARVARARSHAMATRRRLSHSGWEPLVRGDDALGTVGENVAYAYPTAESVMRGWLASPGHRANILHASFHRTGVGCIVDAGGKRWWTQDFAD